MGMTLNHNETAVRQGCLGRAWNNHSETALRGIVLNNNEAVR